MVKSMGRKDIITKEYMEDTEVLEHFTSNFREVMQFIKYSKDTEKLESASQAAPILLDCLSKLEYRGYDSVGLAVRDGENKTRIVKAKGSLKESARSMRIWL